MRLFKIMLVAMILSSAPAVAQTPAVPTPPAIYLDPPMDLARPASTLAIEITSHGSVMNGMVYRPAGLGPFPLVVLMHGLPGNEQNLDLAQAVRDHCHPSVIRADNAELFKRMVFNVLLSNDDDHLRNHAFVWEPRLGGWRLSPLYDVLPRASHAMERFLHLSLGPLGRLATLDNALAAHGMFTLSRATACELIADIWRVVREWRSYFESFGVAAQEIDKIAPAFRHVRDVSTPALCKQLT